MGLDTPNMWFISSYICCPIFCIDSCLFCWLQRVSDRATDSENLRIMSKPALTIRGNKPRCRNLAERCS